MRVIVTGGAGFIGSAVVRAFLDRHRAQVAVFDSMTYAASPQTLSAYRQRPDFTFYQRDICDVKRFARRSPNSSPMRSFIWRRSRTSTARSTSRPNSSRPMWSAPRFCSTPASRYWKELTGARKAAFRFIHVSTDEVYGALGETGAFTEATPYSPRSPYSASKAASDHLAHAWHHTFGLPTIVTNCSNNYGPYQFPEKLIPLMILRGLAGQPMPVYGQGRTCATGCSSTTTPKRFGWC